MLKPRCFEPEELIHTGEPFEIKRFVLIQHIFYQGYDYSYLVNAEDMYPGRFAVVGALDVNDKNLVGKIKADSGTCVSGYRIPSAGKNENWLKGPEMERMWKAAADYGQAICLLRQTNVSLASIEDRLKKFPKTRVVIDHLGHVDYNNEKEVDAFLKLADYGNLFVKVSKFYGNGKMKVPYLDMLPWIKKVVSTFGSERLMWASDCPYQIMDGHSYKASVEILTKHADFLSEKDKQNLFRNTAERVYFRG